MVLLDEFFIKFDDKWGTYAPGGKVICEMKICYINKIKKLN